MPDQTNGIPKVTRAIVPCLIAVLGLSLPSHAQFVEPGTVVIHTFTGEAAGDQFGWVSDDIGDITGDGVHDLVITAPGNDAGGTNTGRIYVYNGATGALVFPPINGTISNSRTGTSIGPAGDVNMDGVTDIVAGAPSTLQGRVYIYSGANGSLLRTYFGELNGDSFGSAVKGVGDLDGDGYSDILVGAQLNDVSGSNSGKAYVYSGAPAQTLICTMNGIDGNDHLGSSVDVIGDITGDGIADLCVGAETAGVGTTLGTGRAYVYSGADCLLGGTVAAIRTHIPPPPASRFGQFFVDGEADVNNDGTPDYYVSDYNVNRAHIYSGATGAIIWTFTGDANGGFGIGRMAGDVDQDGWDDLLLAAWISGVGGNQAGKAFVYSGRTGGLLETFTHNVVLAQLGFDANSMGDVNGDGKIDHLLTAANDSSARGKAYLVAGTVALFSRADIDLDGDVDTDDAEALAAVLVDSPMLPLHAQRADVNDDSLTNSADIQAFVDAIVP